MQLLKQNFDFEEKAEKKSSIKHNWIILFFTYWFCLDYD